MTTRRPLIVNAFALAGANHLSPGLWRSPQDRHGREYTRLDYWIDLAKRLDDAGFAALFLADLIGVPSAYEGSYASSFRTSAQAPSIDPVPVISGLIGHTRRLGFGVTVSTTYSEPYLTSRLFSTLDHLSNGRIGWNIVTSSSRSAALALGLKNLPVHDDRYARADEFVDVAYELWEGSWRDDALVADVDAGIYVDADRVASIEHHGNHFDVQGPFAAPPSPQRVPLLFQAGSSSAGLAFAGRNAEVVFLAGNSNLKLRDERLAILAQAEEVGRNPDDLRFLNALTVVTGESAAAAQEKDAHYRSLASAEGGLTLLSGWTGIDWSKHDLDQPVAALATDAQQSILPELAGEYGDAWTLREAAEYIAYGGLRPVLVGDGASVADQIEAIVDESGIDGFNLANIVSPGSYIDFIDHVVPELRRRGLWADSQETTLRGRIFGQDRLSDRHPAARHRDVARVDA